MANGFEVGAAPFRGLSRGIRQGASLGFEARRLRQQEAQQTQLQVRQEQQDRFAQESRKISTLTSIMGSKSLPIKLRVQATNALASLSGDFSPVTEEDFIDKEKLFTEASKNISAVLADKALSIRQKAIAVNETGKELGSNILKLAPLQEKAISGLRREQNINTILGETNAEQSSVRRQQLGGLSEEQLLGQAEDQIFGPGKPITETQLRANIIQEQLNKKLITPDQALHFLGKKGVQVKRDADGSFSVDIGGTRAGREITKKVESDLTGGIKNAQAQLSEFNIIANDPRFDPDKVLDVSGRTLASIGTGFSMVSPLISRLIGDTDPQALTKALGVLVPKQNRAALESLIEAQFTAWRRSVTGVAFREQEETALRRVFPNIKDDPVAFKTKLQTLIAANERMIQRLQQFDPNSPIREELKIDPLAEITNVNPQHSQQKGGLPPGITEEDIVETIRTNPGETRESIMSKLQGQ